MVVIKSSTVFSDQHFPTRAKALESMKSKYQTIFFLLKYGTWNLLYVSRSVTLRFIPFNLLSIYFRFIVFHLECDIDIFVSSFFFKTVLEQCSNIWKNDLRKGEKIKYAKGDRKMNENKQHGRWWWFGSFWWFYDPLTEYSDFVVCSSKNRFYLTK